MSADSDEPTVGDGEAQRFPLAIIPLALLVLVGIVAGLLLADRDDAGLTPTGTAPTAVTTTITGH